MDSEDRKVASQAGALMLGVFVSVLAAAATAGLAWRLFTLIGGI